MDLAYDDLVEWKKDKEKLLEVYARQNGIKICLRKKVRNAIQTILHNTANGMPFEEASDEAATFISTRTNLDYDAILNLLQQEPNRKRTSNTHGFRRVLHQSGIVLTSDKFNWFRNFSEADLRQLDARYGSISPSSPFFWSIHPSLYEELDVYNPIEGFASPFNFNARRWCSRYEEDKTFGALGNFFTVIQEEFTTPTLWIINPPYTIYIFDEVLKAVIKRRELYPEDDYLFLVPGWEGLKIRTYIQENGSLCDMEAGTYKIFDFSANLDVIPPVCMSLGYIGTRLNIDVLADIILV